MKSKKVNIKKQIKILKRMIKKNPNDLKLLNMLEGLLSFEN